MAKRRCFSIDVMESDKYLDLSPQAKVLYVHFNLKSDDEGVVINPVSAMRFLGLDKRYLDELIDSGFILDIEGLYIVAHWQMHNRIPPSKMNPSVYHSKIKKLMLTDENIYTPLPRRPLIPVSEN